MSYTCPDANDDIAEVVTAYFANTESGGSADPHAAMCEIREILALLAVEQPATRALAGPSPAEPPWYLMCSCLKYLNPLPKRRPQGSSPRRPQSLQRL